MFSECTSLTEITIPDSVTIINPYSFMNCTSLTEIAIPDKVTFVDRCAFQGCSSITKVIFNGNKPTLGDNAFELNTVSPERTYDVQSNGWANANTFPGYTYTKWNYLYDINTYIYTQTGWKKAIPYVWDGVSWKKGKSYVKTESGWEE